MKTLTVKEAAKKVNRSEALIANWIKKGKIEAKKVSDEVNGRSISRWSIDPVSLREATKGIRKYKKTTLMSLDLDTKLPKETTTTPADMHFEWKEKTLPTQEYVVALLVPVGSAKSILQKVLG